MAAQSARFSDVVASAYDRLELDLRSIVEQLRAAERGIQVLTKSPELSRTLSSMLLVSVND